jgi:hypothetical protein
MGGGDEILRIELDRLGKKEEKFVLMGVNGIECLSFKINHCCLLMQQDGGSLFVKTSYEIALNFKFILSLIGGFCAAL